MNLAILGGFGEAPPGGWVKEVAIACLGGGELDLTLSPPGRDASLTAIAVLGSIEIVVPPGSRVRLSDAGALGSRRFDVDRGPGLQFSVRAVGILGSVEVKETVGVTSGSPA